MNGQHVRKEICLWTHRDLPASPILDHGSHLWWDDTQQRINRTSPVVFGWVTASPQKNHALLTCIAISVDLVNSNFELFVFLPASAETNNRMANNPPSDLMDSITLSRLLPEQSMYHSTTTNTTATQLDRTSPEINTEPLIQPRERERTGEQWRRPVVEKRMDTLWAVAYAAVAGRSLFAIKSQLYWSKIRNHMYTRTILHNSTIAKFIRIRKGSTTYITHNRIDNPIHTFILTRTQTNHINRSIHYTDNCCRSGNLYTHTNNG